MTDKLLHNLQLVFIPCLESAGVVENITVMVREDQFVLDVVFATLHKQDPHDRPSQRKINLAYLHPSIELWNLVRW
jgi:hypothetical protein